MNDDRALPFLEAIRAEPDDDAPRLIFADWLEEQGQAERGEFIRLQCRLAEIDPNDETDEWFELKAREAQLLRRHGGHWAGDIRSVAKRWEFRRGFIEKVRISSHKYFENNSFMWRHAPIRDVRITNIPEFRGTVEFAHQLHDYPRTSELEALDIGIDHHPSALRFSQAFGGLAPLKRLREYRFRRGMGDQAEAVLKALTQGQVLRDLAALHLIQAQPSGRPELTKPIASLLERGFPRLRSLGLQGWDIPREGGHALWNSSWFESLRNLDLSGSDCGAANPLCSPQSKGLRTIKAADLSMRIGDVFHARALVECRLDQQTSKPMISHLGQSDSLTTLDLGLAAYISADLPHSLGETLTQPLRSLTLRHSLPDSSLLFSMPTESALAETRSFTIRGSGNRMISAYSDRDLAAFLAAAPFANLRRLSLEHCDFGSLSAGVLAKSRSSRFSELRTLRLVGHNMDEAGLNALIESESLDRLVELDVRSGTEPLSKAVQTRLRDRFGPDVFYHRPRLGD